MKATFEFKKGKPQTTGTYIVMLWDGSISNDYYHSGDGEWSCYGGEVEYYCKFSDMKVEED
jgi:hypothetical protein